MSVAFEKTSGGEQKNFVQSLIEHRQPARVAIRFRLVVMNAVSDLIRAIKTVQTKAREGIHSTKTHFALSTILFDRLEEAVEGGDNRGLPLDRQAAYELLKKQMGEHAPFDIPSAFNTAVDSITKRLNGVRDKSLTASPAGDGIGAACIRWMIDGLYHRVSVNGPRVEGYSYLSLSVHHDPLPNSADGHAVETGELPRRVPSPVSLPSEVSERLTRTEQLVADALDMFGADPRHLALIRQHLLTVADTLQDASLQLCRGKILTEYDDCSLLTRCVAALNSGDELLGLTEWETDAHWWQTDDGRRFREANATAVAHGAGVRRIFLYTAEKRSPRMDKEMTQHRELGVQVRAVSLSKVRRHRPGTGSVRSQCVLRSLNEPNEWGWLTYSVETNNDGRPLRNCFTLQGREMKENRLLLEEIWEHARE